MLQLNALYARICRLMGQNGDNRVHSKKYDAMAESPLTHG